MIQYTTGYKRNDYRRTWVDRLSFLFAGDASFGFLFKDDLSDQAGNVCCCTTSYYTLWIIAGIHIFTCGIFDIQLF